MEGNDDISDGPSLGDQAFIDRVLAQSEPGVVGTRLVVLGFSAVLHNQLGWQFRLPHEATVAVNLLAVRPESADPKLPPLLSRGFVTRPELRIGTVDELVALYRQELMAVLYKADETAGDRIALMDTANAFGDLPPGTVPPLFGP